MVLWKIILITLQTLYSQIAKNYLEKLASNNIEIMHPCTICGKTFSIVTELLQHFKNHFNNENISKKESIEPNFKCDSCNKTFENENNLKNHHKD